MIRKNLTHAEDLLYARQFKNPPGFLSPGIAARWYVYESECRAVEIKSVFPTRKKGPAPGYFAPPRMGLRLALLIRVPDYTGQNEGRQRDTLRYQREAAGIR